MKNETIYLTFYKHEELETYYAIRVAWNGRRIVYHGMNIPELRCDAFFFAKKQNVYSKVEISRDFLEEECKKINADKVWNECPDLINSLMNEFNNIQRTRFGISLDSGRPVYLHMIDFVEKEKNDVEKETEQCLLPES